MPICEICNYVRTEYFHKLSKYSYYLCFSCYTLFLHPKPTQKQINHYYKKYFNYKAGELNEKLIRKRAKVILKNLMNLNLKGKTLFDIGSGYGYFLDEAIKLVISAFGIEPSKTLFTISIKHLIEIIIKNLTFEKYYELNKNKKFDFITLIHTTEHILNPHETIYKAIKLLNPGGILYIETPNLDSHLFNTEKYEYTFLTPPDHIWIFSLKSFQKILKNIPDFKIEKFSTYSYPEHLMGIIKKKFKILSMKSGTITNYQNSNKDHSSNPLLIKEGNKKGGVSDFKYMLFDKFLSPLFTPLLNLGNKGSILELYIKKK